MSKFNLRKKLGNSLHSTAKAVENVSFHKVRNDTANFLEKVASKIRGSYQASIIRAHYEAS